MKVQDTRLVYLPIPTIVFSFYFVFYQKDNRSVYGMPYGNPDKVKYSLKDYLTHPDISELYDAQLKDFLYYLLFHKIDKPYLYREQSSCSPLIPLFSQMGSSWIFNEHFPLQYRMHSLFFQMDII